MGLEDFRVFADFNMRVSSILWGLAGFLEVGEVRPVRPLALHECVCFSNDCDIFKPGLNERFQNGIVGSQ